MSQCTFSSSSKYSPCWLLPVYWFQIASSHYHSIIQNEMSSLCFENAVMFIFSFAFHIMISACRIQYPVVRLILCLFISFTCWTCLSGKLFLPFSPTKCWNYLWQPTKTMWITDESFRWIEVKRDVKHTNSSSSQHGRFVVFLPVLCRLTWKTNIYLFCFIFPIHSLTCFGSSNLLRINKKLDSWMPHILFLFLILQ